MEKQYKYHLLTWGGFYNEQYKSIHNEEEGNFFFSTEEGRKSYIEYLRGIEKELNARHLVISMSEGYSFERTILHRVIRFEGKEFYTQYDMGINFPFGAAKYHMEYKWRPGFNDDPLGEDFDYSKVEIVQEWITGAFDINNED